MLFSRNVISSQDLQVNQFGRRLQSGGGVIEATFSIFPIQGEGHKDMLAFLRCAKQACDIALDFN